MISKTAVVLAASLCASSCASLTPKDNKAAAHERWSQVRAKFKHQLAHQQYEGGLFNEAVLSATEALSLDPQQIDAYIVLARANLELGKPATAEAAVEAATKHGLTSAELLYTEGVILEQRRDLALALDRFTRARGINPRKVEFLIAEAECLVALGRAEEAATLLDESRNRYDDNASVTLLAGHLAQLRGDPTAATQYYRQAREHARESPSVTRELGMLLAQSKQCPEAIAFLSTVLEEEPDEKIANGDARRALADCQLQCDMPDAAIETLRGYVRSHPDDALAQLILAKAALAADDLVTALRAADEAWRLEPQRCEVWFVRAALFFRRGEHNAASVLLQDVLANNPNDVDALCLLAEVMRAQRRHDGARGYFQRALDIDSKCVWAKAGLDAVLNESSPGASTPTAKLTAAESSHMK